eukprot:GFYU01007287.1.p1 GENE.GFYU01007287.1~~GFYU01007287.1.p1  ORF type:complete len:271 (-),score=33.03 GFYU01007287.1:427-1239(-)
MTVEEYGNGQFYGGRPVSCLSVHFRIHYQTAWGQRLRVVGNHVALGMWKPSNGLYLEWGGDGYWVGKFVLPIDLRLDQLRYKYVVTDDNDMSFTRWESGPDRTLVLGCQRHAVDVWRDKENMTPLTAGPAILKASSACRGEQYYTCHEPVEPINGETSWVELASAKSESARVKFAPQHIEYHPAPSKHQMVPINEEGTKVNYSNAVLQMMKQSKARAPPAATQTAYVKQFSRKTLQYLASSAESQHLLSHLMRTSYRSMVGSTGTSLHVY